MVRRRCRRIVVVDASCDPKYQFDDLERAIRIIRTDFNVNITFPRGVPIPQSVQAGKQLPFAVGEIHYGPGESGQLIYFKPVLSGRESLDVVQFAATCHRAGIPFPHHSTGNQFFNESLFEAYRALGYQIVTNSNLPTWSALSSLTSPDHQLSIDGESSALASTGDAKASVPARAAKGVSSVLSWDSLPIWALLFLLGLPLLHPKREQSQETLIALLPQEQTEGFNITLVEQMSLSFGNNSRIMLPLFEEASICHLPEPNSPAHCKVGEDLTKGEVALLNNLSTVLSSCADSGPLIFHIRGYSSTSDFKDEPSKDKSMRRNLDLADRRAQKVQDNLQAAAAKVPENARPIVLLWSAMASPEAAYKEMAKGQYGDSIAVSSYDKTGQNINRRVDIELTQMGRCTLEQVWSGLRQPSNSGTK
jgi:hypothetical protein